MNLALPFVLAALASPPAILCAWVDPATLECTALGLSEERRLPEWELYAEGRDGWCDRARGYRVRLYPVPGAEHVVVVRWGTGVRRQTLGCAVGEAGCRSVKGADVRGAPRSPPPATSP